MATDEKNDEWCDIGRKNYSIITQTSSISYKNQRTPERFLNTLKNYDLNPVLVDLKVQILGW